MTESGHIEVTGNQWVDGLTNREARHALANVLTAIESGQPDQLRGVVERIEMQAYGEQG